MSDSLVYVGMTSEEALWRLLQLQGLTTTRQEWREQYAGNDSAEAVLFELDALGIGVRLVRCQSSDLRFLELPFLLQMDDGRWLLSRERGVLEGASGVVPLASVSPRIALQIATKITGRQSLWHAVGSLLLRRKPLLLQVGAASLIMMLLGLIPPQITRVTMDSALPGGAASLLQLLAFGILLSTLFQAWTGWLRSRAVLYLKTSIETALGPRFLSHLLTLSLSFLGGKTRGQLLQGFGGLGAAQNLLTEGAIGAVLDGVTGVVYLVFLVSLMPGPAASVVGAALVMAILAVVVGRIQARVQRTETQAQTEQRDFLVDLVSGVATVKAAGAEDRALHEWLRRLMLELSLGLRRQRVALWSDIGLELISQMLAVAILVWGGILVLGGAATVGSLLAFLQLSAGFIGSVLGLCGAYLSYTILQPQLSIATEIFAREPEPKPARSRTRSLGGPVVLDNVWFRYAPASPWVVSDLNIQVQVGEKRWIQGPSGFGKSTILRLISGLYQPERGTIRLGGREPAAASDLMIYLPQSVQLYGGSILENLRIFSGRSSRERLLDAAQASGLDTIVSGLPMGYDTILPPGGGTLSGGERQLVALTAVMASDRSLFLLDEALANLDWVSRSWVDQSEWFEGKTVIYASHDANFSDFVRTD